jgi:hypothetical protein
MPDTLFPFQVALTEWAIRKGRAAIFADCGLGKTFMQLVWAENVARHTGGRVLILTPLAVAKQIEREGHRFGYPAHVIRDQSEAREGINICNYDRLHLIDPAAFGVVTLDS